MSEVEQRPRVVMADYGWQWSQWVNLLVQSILYISLFSMSLLMGCQLKKKNSTQANWGNTFLERGH